MTPLVLQAEQKRIFVALRTQVHFGLEATIAKIRRMTADGTKQTFQPTLFYVRFRG